MSLSVDPPVFPPKPTLPFLSHGPPMTRIHLYKRAIHLSPWHHHPSLTEKLHHLSIKGHLNEAINLLHQTTINGSKVSSESYLSLIRACTRLKAFTHGCEIHKHIINNMIEPNIVLQNNLTIFYSKGGNLEEARKMFDKMRERNIFSWTTMIGAYCNSGNSEEAYHLFIEMVSTGLRADNFLYPSVFKACGAMRALEQGKRVHSDYIKSGFLWDPVIHNSVIDMYAKCGSIVDARLVYNEMIERDTFTWTTMITSYVQSGNCTAALDIFREMLERETKQNSAAMASILPVFADMGFLEQGKQVHGLIIASGFGFDKFVGSSLIDMYSKCGSIECARYIFDRIIERDIVSWTAMIQGYSQKGLCHESLRLFLQMVENGMNPNWVSWQCIVTQFLERGSVQSVLKLIEHLELASIRPDSSCISVLLPVFAHVTEREQVKLIHGYLKRNGYIYDSYVGSAIIDIYSGFNDLEAAREVFDAISVKYTSSWCSMIACYSKNGYSDQALELFSKMIWSNQTPDQSTMESILSVVSNIDSLEYGKQIHGVLVRTSIEMNKFLESTLINMYGNCGEVNFAFKLFDSMASKDIVSWNAIIG
ncbi:pentatricopeptide repeat-containing protein At4g39530, partial [Amborella trichopoda]